MNADWFIDNPNRPELKSTVRPFRPTLTTGMQQVRAQVTGKLTARFDYLFDAGRGKWIPLLGDEKLSDEQTSTTWSQVMGFREAIDGEAPSQMLLPDLRETSPKSG